MHEQKGNALFKLVRIDCVDLDWYTCIYM